jgi:DNA-binding beta-propeller fold protein YncE
LCAGALLAVAATVADVRPSAPRTPEQPVTELAVQKIQTGVDPANLVFHDGKLYTSGFRAGRVTALDLSTSKTFGDTRLDGYEHAVAEVDGKPTRTYRHCAGGTIVRAAERLFVEQLFGDSLLVVDPDSMLVIKRLDLGTGKLAATPDGKTVVCASNSKNEFHLIDAETYQHRTVGYPRGSTGIGAVVVSPDGRFVVLGLQRGGQPPNRKAPIVGNTYLAVYDLEQKKYAATLYLASDDTQVVSEFVGALVYAPGGKTLYAGMFQATTGVRVIDPVKWTIRDDIRFEPNALNKHFKYTNPLGLMFYCGWLFVANRENQEVVVIDPATRKAVAQLRFADGKHNFHSILAERGRILLADQEAVYELDAEALARLLTAHVEKPNPSLLELQLKVREK